MHEKKRTLVNYRDCVQPASILLGTINPNGSLYEALMEQRTLYNAQPCTPLHFQLIRSAQLQKGERLPRQPPISPPPSPSVPLSRLLSAEVAWQREVQPLLYWNQCKSMRLHNKACMESWEQWGEKQRLHTHARPFSCNIHKDLITEDLSWRFFHLLWNKRIVFFLVLPTRAYPWNFYSCVARKWVFHILVRGCAEEDCASFTRVGAEVRPRTDVREECTESTQKNNSPTTSLLFLFFCSLSLVCVCVCVVFFLFWRCVFAETILSQRRWKWFHAFSLAQPEMDVRFYPAPPANVGSCSLPTDPSCLSSLDYYHSNKVNNPPRSRVHPNASFLTCLSVCLCQHTMFTHCKRTLCTDAFFPSTGAHLLQNVKCQQLKWHWAWMRCC